MEAILTLETMCREIMHSMWRPARFKYVYVFCCLYVLSITIPHSVTVYWAFGDTLLHKNNAFAVFKPSNARSAAIVMMIMHQVRTSSQMA
jgi:auxin influx carrier (AUX1 LAX family)